MVKRKIELRKKKLKNELKQHVFCYVTLNYVRLDNLLELPQGPKEKKNKIHEKSHR